MSSLSGKAAVKAAKELTQEHGVEVLGYNCSVGKEFLSVNGGGDKDALSALKKDLEKEGWHALPQNKASGYFMDFSLYIPPAGAVTINSDEEDDDPYVLEEDASVLPPVVKSTFLYTGLNIPIFFKSWVLSSILLILITHMYKDGHEDFISPGARLTALIMSGLLNAFQIHWTMVSMVTTTIIIGIICLTICWKKISANNEELIIRKGLFGKTKEISFSKIKSAKVFLKKYKNRTEKYLVVGLKKGKALDLYLPEKKQYELAAFIRDKIS